MVSHHKLSHISKVLSLDFGSAKCCLTEIRFGTVAVNFYSQISLDVLLMRLHSLLVGLLRPWLGLLLHMLQQTAAQIVA